VNSSRQRVDISRVASIAALAIALLIVALLLWRTWQSAQFSAGIFGYPFQVDESEGMIAAETLLLDQGQNIYNFPGPQQFVAAPYPPLYYLLNLPLIHFTGYSLKVGRTLTILSTLAAAALLFALVKLATRRRLAAIIAALAFLASSLTAFWGAIVKPDLPAMAFALLGLYLVALSIVGQQGGPPPAPTNAGSVPVQHRDPNSQFTIHNSTFAALAVAAFALAMLTKQTSVAAAGAGFVVLLFSDWRRGLKAIGLYVAIVGGVSLLLDGQTAGGYFWHIVTVHTLPWNFDRLVSYVQTIWSVNWPLILMGALGLIVAIASAIRGTSQRIRFNGETGKTDVGAQFIAPVPPIPNQGVIYHAPTEPNQGVINHAPTNIQNSKLAFMLLLYALAAVVQASGVGTLGGVHNHFLDALSALCIGFGLLLGWLLDRANDVGSALPLRVAGLIGLCVAAVLVWLLIGAEYDPHDLNAYQFRLPSAAQLEGMSNIAQFATNNGGPLYSDNVSIVLSAHQRLRSTDPYTQTHASSPAIHPNPADRWDERQLVADIRAGKFALIILAPSDPCKGGGGEVSPAIAAAVCDSYKLIQRNVEYIYQPR